MAKKTQDLKPDTILKNYWRDNAQFADIFNAVLFEGRQVILPEELEDVDTEESSVMEHRDYAQSIKASRDNIKVSKRSTTYGVAFTLLGMESQEHIHYAMPMRVMGYDYGTYKKQYDSNARQYKTADGMEQDEYLSRMKKTDKFMPVITFVNDYKMLLVEARKNNLTLHNINNVNFFNLLEILLDKSKPLQETKSKAIAYAREHEVDKHVIMTVAGATNCKIDYHTFDKKGDVDMCTVFEETRAEGIAEGRIEGRIEGKAEGIIETGLDFGLSEEDILERLQKKLNISLQAAQEYLKMFGK